MKLKFKIIREMKKMNQIHQPIVEACAGCTKIFDFAPPQGMIPYEACHVYIDPAKIQCRMGRTDACGVKPAQELEKKKTPGMVLKRKFGRKTR
jgi:hypothetical protein